MPAWHSPSQRVTTNLSSESEAVFKAEQWIWTSPLFVDNSILQLPLKAQPMCIPHTGLSLCRMGLSWIASLLSLEVMETLVIPHREMYFGSNDKFDRTVNSPILRNVKKLRQQATHIMCVSDLSADGSPTFELLQCLWTYWESFCSSSLFLTLPS